MLTPRPTDLKTASDGWLKQTPEWPTPSSEPACRRGSWWRTCRDGPGRSDPFQAVHHSAATRCHRGNPHLCYRLRLSRSGRCDSAIAVLRIAESGLRGHRTSVVASPWLVLSGLLTALTIRYLPGNGGHSPAFGFSTGGGPVTARELPGVALAALTSALVRCSDPKHL
jgi:hypothetical protein